MSDFHIALPIVLKHEGIYSNDLADPGGATKYGISLQYLQSSGQGDFDLDGDIDIEDIKTMSLEDAKSIYFRDWWLRHGYENIEDQDIATKLLDLSINMGARQAHKIIQRATWSVKSSHQYIKDDGVLGHLTMKTINDIDRKLQSKPLIAAIRSEAAGFYRSLNRPRFIRGWLNRAYA